MARTSVMDDPVFQNGPTHAKVVEAFCAAHVFPPDLTYEGVGVHRDNVIAERVERDGNRWWISCRARYSGTILGFGVAERARVHYDDGHISIDIGGMHGVLNTAGLTGFVSNIAAHAHLVNGGINIDPWAELDHVQRIRARQAGPVERWYLDIAANDAVQTIGGHQSSRCCIVTENAGCRWQFVPINANQHIYKIRARSAGPQFEGWFLDIDAGAPVVSIGGHQSSRNLLLTMDTGVGWRATPRASGFRFQAVRANQFEDWFLDVDAGAQHQTIDGHRSARAMVLTSDTGVVWE